MNSRTTPTTITWAAYFFRSRALAQPDGVLGRLCPVSEVEILQETRQSNIQLASNESVAYKRK